MIVRLSLVLFVSLCALFCGCTQSSDSKKEDIVINNLNSTPAFTSLKCGEIKPLGWVKTQMLSDMNGFVGNLDRLVPTLISDPIYGEARLHSKSKFVELGNNKEGDATGEEQYKWWNSETQSNWWDGYIRNALLLDSQKDRQRVDLYIEKILSTQDDDGYLGIYTPELRYKFKSENGELWSKSTLYRSLLGYFEATGNEKVWNALVRAVDNVMTNYPINASKPFDAGKEYNGGVGHGLTFTDVLDRMYEITGNKKYIEYAEFLYKDYSRHFAWEEDAKIDNILNKDYNLKCHAVHTFEHIRPLLVAATVSKDPKIKSALKKYLDRVSRLVTPTGGAIGDEWIGGRTADATHTGYEYCSLHELMDSYIALYQKTGLAKYAEFAENIFYNAAQGARHPNCSSIAYLKTDNSYAMKGSRNYDNESDREQTRYKYSPVHQDVAVCCVPNAGRITPYFVQKSWLKEGERTIIANFLAPNIVNTKIGSENVRIENITEFPFSNDFKFKIYVDKPIRLCLKIRKPSWVNSINCSDEYNETNGYLIINRTFGINDSISLKFNTSVRIVKDFNDLTYFAYGALFYALPIKANEIKGRKYAPEFVDMYYEETEQQRYEVAGNPEAKYLDGTILVCLKNKSSGIMETVTLIPMKNTILRQMAF